MSQKGGCVCGAIRYLVSSEPLFLHVCHCTECQASSGSAFTTTLITEISNFRVLQGIPKVSDSFTGQSGKGYDLSSCRQCGTGLWATEKELPKGLLFLRAGTLDNTRNLEPMAHIYTKSKQKWLILPDDVPTFEEGYRTEDLWPAESIERLNQLFSR